LINSKGGKMAALLEKIPVEKRWAITSNALLRLYTSRGTRWMPLILSKGEGIFAPIMATEKWTEILSKMFIDGATKFFPLFKERFNVPVEDAIEAQKLVWIVATLMEGPEWEGEFVEKTTERAVWRINKCPYWERYEEFGIDLVLRTCDAVHQLFGEAGFKAINFKITRTLKKALPRGFFKQKTAYEIKRE
jgi:hypothetical protein